MGLRDLDLQTRRRLHRHAWLLSLGCVGIGVATRWPLLHEVAVQFVLGAYIARRVIRPQAHEAAFLSIVGRTWRAGIVIVVASAGASWLVMQINPGGAAIADLFR